jgi:hypothetical protein
VNAALAAGALQPPDVTTHERDLLRCCLLPPAEAVLAWQNLTGQGDPEIPASLQPLLGLLGERVTPAGIRPAEPLAGRLRAAQVIEQQRNEALREIAAHIAGLPALAALRPLIVGGLASAMLAWPQPMLRHTSRIALLLPSARAAIDAARILTSGSEFTIERGGRWTGSALRLSHRSGMPLLLHGGYCAAPAWGMDHARLASRAVPGRVMEHDVVLGDRQSCLALAALDGLKKREEGASLLWLADAVFLLRQLGENERALYLPPAVILPLIRRAAEIDPALQLQNDAVSPDEVVGAIAALHGMPAALAPMRAARRLFWFCRLAPRAIAGGVRDRLRPRF